MILRADGLGAALRSGRRLDLQPASISSRRVASKESMADIGLRYLEHLGDGDLAFLADAARVVTDTPAEAASYVRARPELVERLLGHPAAYGRLFEATRGEGAFLRTSPFLVFAVLVQHCAKELDRAAYIEEWVGPRKRLPVFDVDNLRHFLRDPVHRLFLAELLGSYTHVASGAVWVQGRKGLRRQRFSELDPVRLASLLDVVPENERPGIYRRLGDLTLFLTGVFPDRSATWSLSPIDAARLKRAGEGERRARNADASRSIGIEDEGSLSLLEQLGERWYRLACSTAASPNTSAMQVVASVAERFGQARRILNFMADRHLFPLRSRWFPPGLNA